jgi:hypothetical protein
MSRMTAKSDTYARSEDSNFNNTCVRFDIVGVGARLKDEDATSSSRGDMTVGESVHSPSGDCGPLFKSIDSDTSDNDA